MISSINHNFLLAISLQIWIKIVFYLYIVDGEWSDYYPSTPCSKTCGNGKKFKFRLCNNPPPQHGGKNCSCVDNISELMECNETVIRLEMNCTDSPCPDDPYLGIFVIALQVFFRKSIQTKIVF